MRSRHLALLALALSAGWLAHAFLGGSADVRPERGSGLRGRYDRDGRWEGPALVSLDRPPNLIVIVLDTLRADAAAPGRDMPHLERLAEGGLTVSNCASPAVWTFPALTSLMTGLHPSVHRVAQSPTSVFLSPEVTTFTEALAMTHGYETAAMIEVDFPSQHNTILQGFQHVERRMPLRGTRQAVRRWAQRRDPSKPFFLFIHTYEAHTPYGQVNRPWPERPFPPEASPYKDQDPLKLSDAELVEAVALDWRARKALLGGKVRRKVIDRTVAYRGLGWAADPDPALARRLETAYRSGVRELDEELHKTIRSLRRLGLLDDTLLVVTSDHGEAFGEHGVLEHGLSVHDELVRVPLVMVGPPPFDGGRSIPTSMAVHDLLPTFFDYAGLPQLRGVQGQSMLGDLRAGKAGRGVLTMEWIVPSAVGGSDGRLMLSARTAHEKYIIIYDVGEGSVIEQLFDLDADPGATTDILLGKGELGQNAVSGSLADAIILARDMIWATTRGAAALALGGYAASGAQAPEGRPTRPVRR